MLASIFSAQVWAGPNENKELGLIATFPGSSSEVSSLNVGFVPYKLRAGEAFQIITTIPGLDCGQINSISTNFPVAWAGLSETKTQQGKDCRVVELVSASTGGSFNWKGLEIRVGDSLLKGGAGKVVILRHHN